MTQQKRKHKIRTDYGSQDYYRFYKKNNPETTLTGREYGEVLRDFNNFVRDNMSLRGQPYKMPQRMGVIELRKRKTEVRIGEDGEIINRLPVNWKETRKLWEDNPEAKEKKIKIKFVNEHTDGYTFKFCYFKISANYKNKTIYKIRFNRTLKRQLSKSIFNKTIDAFVKKNYNEI